MCPWHKTTSKFHNKKLHKEETRETQGDSKWRPKRQLESKHFERLRVTQSSPVILKLMSFKFHTLLFACFLYYFSFARRANPPTICFCIFLFLSITLSEIKIYRKYHSYIGTIYSNLLHSHYALCLLLLFLLSQWWKVLWIFFSNYTFLLLLFIWMNERW
jgi:hypothetical protein